MKITDEQVNEALLKIWEERPDGHQMWSIMQNDTCLETAKVLLAALGFEVEGGDE